MKANQQNKKCSLKDLFLVFAKIGCFTFGGGLVMLPLIQKEVVNNKTWLSEEEFVDLLAVTNSAPGAFAINTSIYVGYSLRGFAGAITAAFGTVLPSFFIILIIALFISNFANNVWVKKFFLGVRPAIIALIFCAGLKLGKVTLKNLFDYILMSIALILILFTPINAISLIILGILTGIIYVWLRHKKEDNKDEHKEVQP